MADLSGRVTSLEGQILALPTNSDLSAYVSLINGRLNTIEAAQSTENDNINLLLQSFANLKDTILNIDAVLTSHTGTTTGQGVHGHN